jgi:hypothetical protein
MLEMKTSINQVQTTVDSIICGQDQRKDQRWRTRLRSYCTQSQWKKMNAHECNIQEL